MLIQIKRIILLLWIICLHDTAIFSQSHSSRDNYTGAWKTPASWNPSWAVPQTNLTGGGDIIINGYITVYGSLSFDVLSSNLIVNDTLVIIGDLYLGDLNNLTVNGNGILILRGNLTFGKNSTIISNNYIIITGFIWKNGSANSGSFVSNTNPAKVFVGGSLNPASIGDKLNFPVLSCLAPTTTPYPNSHCSYGNMTDLTNDPINSFFQSTCTIITPTITASGPITFCAGGSVTLISSSGTGYLWSDGATTASISVTTAGTYTVKVINANGCQSAASVATIVTVNALPATPTISASGPKTFCSGNSVTLTSSAGSTYLWSTGAITQSLNVTSSGSYTVRVTNANGCKSAASVATSATVNASPATPTIFASGPTTFCSGSSVTLTSSAGSTYLWSTGAITQSINVTSSGIYTVRVTNVNGCQSEASPATIISVNAFPVTPTISASGPTTFCSGGNVTLTSSAGSTYLWSSGATTQSINVTASGSYTVRVTNANGCQSAASVATIVTVNALLATPTISANGPTTFCSGGSVTLISSAGISYLWSNGATTSSINVTDPGNYTVFLTDANGCKSPVSAVTGVIVNALPNVNAGTDITIPNGTSTTINATVTGTGPFTYSWSPSAQFVNASVEDPTTVNLPSTTIFTLTAASLTTTCSNTDAVTVNISGGPLNSTPTATPLIICAGAIVQLHALASGGSGSYTYTWTSTPGGFTSSLADPTANPTVSTTYHLAVSDGFTTVNPQVAVIVNASPAMPIITAGGPTTFCAGGSVTLTSSAGTSYLWSNGATTQSINVTDAGSYTVKVTNASGCLSTTSAATVVNINALPVTPTIATDGPTNFCDGGSVNLTSSAGTSYLWSNGTTAPSINVTSSGSYTVKVTNGSGCQSAASVATVVTVNASPASSDITAGGPTTFCTGGSVTLTSSSEASYLWSNGAATQSINVTTAGSYTVKVTNASGCLSPVSAATVVYVNALPGTPTIMTDGPADFCDGGSVKLTSSAGTSYLWSNGAATQSINVTTSGIYTVKVTNGSGCLSAASAVKDVTVNALPPTPIISADGPTTFCDGDSVTLTSGTGTNYLWSNSSTSPSISVTEAGSYTVQVTDASGCQSAPSVATIVSVNALPGIPTLSSDGPTSICEGNSVTLISSAGADYLWSNGETLQSITVSSPGDYAVKVTNVNGCQSAASGSVSIVVNSLPVVTTGNNGPVCTGSTLSLTGGPASMPVYLWSGPGEFTSSFQNPSVSNSATIDMAGIYTLVVTNNDGCTNAAAQNIVVNATPIAVAGPDQELKFSFETQMNAELSGSETGEWSLISGSGHISDIHSPTTGLNELSIGENKFLWKVLNGKCEDTAEVKITVNYPSVPSVITPNGDGKNDYFKIGEYDGKVELIIINRWGNEEYNSDNYINDWDGRNNRGVELPNDTYFYILNFENGKVLKGSVLIKR